MESKYIVYTNAPRHRISRIPSICFIEPNLNRLLGFLKIRKPITRFQLLKPITRFFLNSKTDYSVPKGPIPIANRE